MSTNARGAMFGSIVDQYLEFADATGREQGGYYIIPSSDHRHYYTDNWNTPPLKFNFLVIFISVHILPVRVGRGEPVTRPSEPRQ